MAPAPRLQQQPQSPNRSARPCDGHMAAARSAAAQRWKAQMYNRVNIPLIIAMVLVAMVLSGLFLLGLPKLAIIPSPESPTPGGQFVRLADVSAGRTDLQPIACPRPVLAQCAREKLADGPLWDQITQQSRDLLVRHTIWLMICWAFFIGLGVVYFRRVRRAAERFYKTYGVADPGTIFEHHLYMPMPVAFGTWVFVALAGAYLLALI